MPIKWLKVKSYEIPEEDVKSRVNYSRRMEMKHDKLRMKWAGTDYEIVVEKLEGMASWMDERNQEIKESLVDWLLENDELTLVKEGEDILEQMMDKEMPTFQQVETKTQLRDSAEYAEQTT